MKVGTIVECVDNEDLNYTIKLKLNTPYTIREITPSRRSIKYGIGIGVRLEEVVNGICPIGDEWTYSIERFREIQFPDDLTEQIQECLTKEIKFA